MKSFLQLLTGLSNCLLLSCPWNMLFWFSSAHSLPFDISVTCSFVIFPSQRRSDTVLQPGYCCSFAKFMWGSSFLGLDLHCNCLEFRTLQNWDSHNCVLFIFQVSPLAFMKRQTLTWISSNYLPLYQKGSAALLPLPSPLCSCLTPLPLLCFFVCNFLLWPPSHATVGVRWGLRRWVKQEKEDFVREGENLHELKVLRWSCMSQHPSEPVASTQQRRRK